MISSKYLSVIAIVLVVLVLGFTVYMQLRPDLISPAHVTGEVAYGEGHTAAFTEDDYYSDYSEAAISKITLSGTTATAGSRNVSVDGSDVTIRGGGTYVLSGALSGSIIVDASDGAEVRLVLHNATVTSPDFAALYVKQAAKVVLSLPEGTENHLTDCQSYKEEKLEDGKPTAALYSKDNLTINGKGALTVTGNYQDGIKVNDVLKVTEGTLRVTAADEAINVNDYIAFLEATVEISAGGDGIKCENEDPGKGFIVFEGTTVQIENAEDGIYSSSSVYINGIKAQISVTDDAIHGEKTVSLAPESISVTTCTEGIEGAYITVESGDIHVVSRDDGINARGENSTGGFAQPMGRQKAEITEEDIYLTINGGNIRIETAGDGVDSNGAAVINGGHVEVYGPENNGNSSLDFEYGFLIHGGEVLAAGSAGMAELPSSSSGQNSLVFYLEENYAANSEISVLDETGSVILSGTAAKRFNWVCVSCAQIETGAAYTLLIDGEEIQTVEATDVVTSSGNSGRRW